MHPPTGYATSFTDLPDTTGTNELDIAPDSTAGCPQPRQRDKCQQSSLGTISDPLDVSGSLSAPLYATSFIARAARCARDAAVVMEWAEGRWRVL